RHPLDAAGRARLAAHRHVPPRQSRRGERHRQDLHQPRRPAHAGLYHGPLRLMPIARTRAQQGLDLMSSTHIVSIYDEELKYLSRRISEMGGTAEQMVADAVRALVTTDG